MGNGKSAIIIVSDIFGSSSGRHHAIADTYAKLGYSVYLPELLSPPYQGPIEMEPIMNNVKSQNYEKMREIFKHVLEQAKKGS